MCGETLFCPPLLFLHFCRFQQQRWMQLHLMWKISTRIRTVNVAAFYSILYYRPSVTAAQLATLQWVSANWEHLNELMDLTSQYFLWKLDKVIRLRISTSCQHHTGSADSKCFKSVFQIDCLTWFCYGSCAWTVVQNQGVYLTKPLSTFFRIIL